MACASSLDVEGSPDESSPNERIPVEGISVVICSRDRPALLEAALDAIRSAVRPEDEVVVVDSASRTDATAAVAAAAGCLAVRVDVPGLSLARNAGVGATTRSIVAFTDDDCLPQTGWAAAIERAFADGGVGFVAGRVLPEDREITPSFDPGSEPFRFTSQTEPAHLGVGACLAVRRVALEQVGGFDEALGAGAPLRSGEDHDIGWRILRAGWSGGYEPAVRVVHRETRDIWAFTRRQWSYGMGSGAVAAKIARSDPATGWPLLRHRVGREGLATAVVNLARGWERPALGSLLYATGALAGAARSWRMPLDRGRLVSVPRHRRGS